MGFHSSWILIFHIVDVFAERKYAGNQLAVFRGAKNLDTKTMQSIAREINFSETTFITSDESEGSNSFRVRVFTPNNELPFAGHPTLGTAFAIQHFIKKQSVPKITLILKVGPIEVTPNYNEKGEIETLWMRQNEPSFRLKKFDPHTLAKVLSLDENEIDDRYLIQEVSTGLPFIIVPLKSLDSLKRCALQTKEYRSLISKTKAKSILAFSPKAYVKGHDFGVRVFVEYYGPIEDPATGSGNGCLAAYLSKYKIPGSSKINVTVDQGYEIGRPSTLYLKTDPMRGRVNVFVGGRAQSVALGEWPA